MWRQNLEQNMFCTFLPTGHLSFYDPSPHSTNELINVVHLHVLEQKSDFNIVFFCWGGGGWGLVYGNIHAAARQTLISQGLYFTGSDPVKNALFTGFDIFCPATRNIVCTEDCCKYASNSQCTCKGQNFVVIKIIVSASHLFPLQLCIDIIYYCSILIF